MSEQEAIALSMCQIENVIRDERENIGIDEYSAKSMRAKGKIIAYETALKALRAQRDKGECPVCAEREQRNAEYIHMLLHNPLPADQPKLGVMLNMDNRTNTPINVKLDGQWHTGSAKQFCDYVRAQQERENPQTMLDSLFKTWRSNPRVLARLLVKRHCTYDGCESFELPFGGNERRLEDAIEKTVDYLTSDHAHEPKGEHHE